MRASERVDHLTEITDLARMVSVSQAAAVGKLSEWAGGFPMGGFEGGGKGGHSDRTQTNALNGKGRQKRMNDGTIAQLPDKPWCDFDAQLGLFDASLELALGALREAHRIMLVATIHEKQEETIEWCRSCIRLTNHKGEPTHSPVASDHLCRWCGDFKRQYKRLPDVRILEYRARYGRVTEGIVARYTRRWSPIVD